VGSSDTLSSCEIQYEACGLYLQSQRLHGWTLLKERFDDDGYSGATLDRPALNRLLTLVRRGQIDRILVHRLDRLSRGVGDCLRFSMNSGGVPFGYDADRATRQLVPNDSEEAIVKWMFTEAEAANGCGYRTKVSVAQRTGNKRGGNLWTARQVVATLRNPVHIGMLRDGDGARPGCHQALISDSVFANVAEALDARRTRKPEAFTYGPMWPLKGKLKCGTCGRPLTPHSSRQGNKVYRYYRCRATAGGLPPCRYQVAAGTLESAVADVLPRVHRDELDSHRIRTHVESVLYDNETWTVTVRLVPQDDKTVAVPLGPPGEFSNSGSQ
jgi:hypothetical protein